MERNINYLFNEVPLYTKENFKIFNRIDENFYNIDENEMKRFLYYIGSYDNKLIAYCHKCKKEFPFKKENEISTITGNSYEKIVFAKEYLNGDSFYIDIVKGKWIKLVNHKGLWELLEQGKIWYITYDFNCTNNVNHIYKMMLTVELKEEYLIVRKVGQNPSMITIKGFDFDKYKKILERINAYEDYKKADLSNAEHFFVGAYAYLRRIFEKMVNNFISENEVLEDNHMTTKIEHVKDKFDPRIQRLLSIFMEY